MVQLVDYMCKIFIKFTPVKKMQGDKNLSSLPGFPLCDSDIEEDIEGKNLNKLSGICFTNYLVDVHRYFGGLSEDIDFWTTLPYYPLLSHTKFTGNDHERKPCIVEPVSSSTALSGHLI